MFSSPFHFRPKFIEAEGVNFLIGVPDRVCGISMVGSVLG